MYILSFPRLLSTVILSASTFLGQKRSLHLTFSSIFHDPENHSPQRAMRTRFLCHDDIAGWNKLLRCLVMPCDFKEEELFKTPLCRGRGGGERSQWWQPDCFHLHFTPPPSPPSIPAGLRVQLLLMAPDYSITIWGPCLYQSLSFSNPTFRNSSQDLPRKWVSVGGGILVWSSTSDESVSGNARIIESLARSTASSHGKGLTA